MNVTKETVTPKKAMEWLKRNINNRPLRPQAVKRYVAAMTLGQWKLNGDTIRFNGNGDLIDGQHRLTACVQSGVSFETYVVRGLDHDAFDTIDQNETRNIGDVFARQGYKHYTALASAVRWVWRYKTGMLAKGKQRPDEANEILEENPAIHHAVEIATSLVKKERHLIHGGLLSFLVHECGRTDPAASENFWTSTVTGVGLKAGSAAHRLHQRLVANASAVAKLPSPTICALAIKAWNAFRSGKPVGVLKWSEGEDFPTIIH